MNGVLKSMLKKLFQKKPKGCSSVCIQRSSTSINRVLTIETTVWENSLWTYAGSGSACTKKKTQRLQTGLEKLARVPEIVFIMLIVFTNTIMTNLLDEEGSRRVTKYSYSYLDSTTSVCYSGKVHTK